MTSDKYRNRSRLIKKAAIAVGTLGILCAGVVVTLSGMTRIREQQAIYMEQMDDEDEDKNKTILQRKKLTVGEESYLLKNDLTTYVIIGSDNSDAVPANAEGREQGYICKMADMILVLVVDDKAQTYSILQLDRNTITAVRQLFPSGEIAGELDLQLCTAFFYGNDEATGSENTLKAVSNLLLDTPVTRYITIGMDDIGEINRIAGGVTVTLEDDLTGSDPEMKEGATLTLTDAQAKIFATARMNTGDGSNTGRLRRQRTYLDGLKAKLTEQVKADGKYIDKAYDEMTEIMVSNATEKELGNLAAVLATYRDGGIYTIKGETVLGDHLGDGQLHDEYMIDEDDLTGVVVELFYESSQRAGEYVRNAQADDE